MDTNVETVSTSAQDKVEMNRDRYLPDFCAKKILILGCGNILFGDDGFGPAVIDYLCSHYEIPDDVYVMDVGTGVRKLLFTLCLSSTLPERITMVDAVDKNRLPGVIFELALEEIPSEKVDDFSLHQSPASNLALSLKRMGVDVHVMACQVSQIPQTVSVGLTDPVLRAVPRMSALIAEKYSFGIKHRAGEVD